MVVSNIFHVHHSFGKWSNLTNIFQMGWNHQLAIYNLPLTYVSLLFVTLMPHFTAELFDHTWSRTDLVYRYYFHPCAMQACSMAIGIWCFWMFLVLAIRQKTGQNWRWTVIEILRFLSNSFELARYILGGSSQLHPGRLTWNLQITLWERKMIFPTSMIMFHLNLPGFSKSLVNPMKNAMEFGHLEGE